MISLQVRPGCRVCLVLVLQACDVAGKDFMAWSGLGLVVSLVYGSCCRYALAGRTTSVDGGMAACLMFHGLLQVGCKFMSYCRLKTWFAVTFFCA